MQSRKDMEKVLVVGLGSMGKRRIRLLKQWDPEIRIFGVDSQAERQKEAEELFGIPCFSDIRDAAEHADPEAGFVCTAPLSHAAIILELLQNGLHVFTEINLVDDQYPEILKTAKEKQKTVFLSSTLLYRKDIQYIISKTKDQRVNYTIHTGQYLPDWHPWENYKDFFVGNIRTNGCREIMAIDLPWILSAFGKVKDLHVFKSKDSSLDLDYEDSYIISMEHENGSKGVFVCDLLSRKSGRSAEIFSEDLYITWKGTPDSLTEFDKETKTDQTIRTYREEIDQQNAYASNIIENAYLEEIRTFFGVIRGTEQPRYGFEDDLYTLSVINRIEGRR